MSRVVELLCSRRVPQVAVLALMSIGLRLRADMSSRLSQNPFASRPEATGAVPTATAERRELPPYVRPPAVSVAALPPAISAPANPAAMEGGLEEAADFLLCPARASDRDHRQRPTFGRGNSCPGPRHHHHRRHHRHARVIGSPLQR